MSASRAKSPASSDNINSLDKVSSEPKKTLPALVAKSKIPNLIGNKNNSTQPEAEKIERNEEKPATPNSTQRRSAAAQNQENPTSARRAMAKRGPSAMGFASASVSGRRRVLENQFATKKSRYVSLRHDIVDKQKSSEAQFEDLIRLRERIVSSGGRDPGRLEEIVPAPSTALLRPVAAASVAGEPAGPAEGPDAILIIETSLRQMSEDLLALCSEALSKRTSVLEWLIEYDSEPSDGMPSAHHIKEDMAEQLDTYKVENVEFDTRLDEARRAQLRRVDETIQRVRCLYHECQVYKKERAEGAPADDDKFVEQLKELRLERDKFMKARAKIREQEQALGNWEARWRQAQDGAKQLEAQLKLKEAALEQRSRDIAKLQKSNDAAKAKLERHGDTVEARVCKLKDEMEIKEAEARRMFAEYKKQIRELEADLESERRAARELNAAMDKLRARNDKLEDKCKQLLEMQEKAPQMTEQNTDYDIQLFNDLKRTKRLLAEKEEIVQKLQLERAQIMAAADTDSDSSNERLAAELVSKSNELQATRAQFVQLQKNYQKMQQRAEGLELRLSDVSRLQAQLKESSSGRSYGAQVLQLQQQLSDLRGSLTDTTKQNAELEKTCAQLQLKVDRYKRYLRNLEGNMKVRNEVRSLLQHKDTEPDGAADEQNFNSINGEEYQQVLSILESKEMQVMKLEKLVKQMEKQEEYSQTQRTRLESRIAELEFAAKDSKLGQRNRGFSFL